MYIRSFSVVPLLLNCWLYCLEILFLCLSPPNKPVLYTFFFSYLLEGFVALHVGVTFVVGSFSGVYVGPRSLLSLHIHSWTWLQGQWRTTFNRPLLQAGWQESLSIWHYFHIVHLTFINLVRNRNWAQHKHTHISMYR